MIVKGSELWHITEAGMREHVREGRGGYPTYMGFGVYLLAAARERLSTPGDVAAWIVKKATSVSTHERVGRPADGEPYTQEEIEATPCFRCGSPSHFTWQVCADDRVYRPLCKSCDVELNEMVLRWAGDPGWQAKIAAYKRRVL